MSQILAMLPDSLVAKWNVVVSVAALFNTVQSFLTPKLTKRVYSNTNEGKNHGFYEFN